MSLDSHLPSWSVVPAAFAPPAAQRLRPVDTLVIPAKEHSTASVELTPKGEEGFAQALSWPSGSGPEPRSLLHVISFLVHLDLCQL